MLELKEVNIKLGKFFLKNINLKIKTGEYFVILGPTGTGKTVILEIIAGLYTPDRGKIFFKNKRIDKLPPEERNIGFVYQDYALFPHLTVKENIEFGLKKKETVHKVNELIEILNIKDLLHRYPDNLSGGEQQRTAIARAVAVSPEILLLDEPLSALDPQSKNGFKKELDNLHKLLSTTTVHITHDFTEAIYLADRIAVMQNGEIVQVGTPAQIFKKPKSIFVANFVGMENIFEGKYIDGELVINENLSLTVVDQKLVKNKSFSAAVRPENIIITKHKVESSARNNFEGKVVNIIDQGALNRLTIDIGVPVNVLITHKSLNDLHIKLNDSVWIAFKASAVHLL